MILLLDEPVQVPVNSGLSLREMISRGKYDFVDPDINPERFTFPWAKPSVLEFDFQAPYQPIPNARFWWKKKEDQSWKNPWGDAGITELLAFGEAYPDLQRVVSIVALSPLSKTRRFGFTLVPCLDVSEAGRCLRLIHEREAYSGKYINLVSRRRESDVH